MANTPPEILASRSSNRSKSSRGLARSRAMSVMATEHYLGRRKHIAVQVTKAIESTWIRAVTYAELTAIAHRRGDARRAALFSAEAFVIAEAITAALASSSRFARASNTSTSPVISR